MSNFKSNEDDLPPRALKHPQQAQKDALRALTQRGHDSVYQKAHASSESNDELAGPPHVAGLNRKVRREKASMGSLKRASADVELLAPRSPMGKETMVTFSNTLPRAFTNTAEELLSNGGGGNGSCGGGGTAQRHMTFHVPMDPQRSRQLVSEWRQKSVEMKSLSPREEEQDGAAGGGEEAETSAGGGAAPGAPGGAGGAGGKEDLGVPPHSTLYPTVQAANRGGGAPQPGPGGARVVLPPKVPGAPPLVHIPEEATRPPPVSPKSATTRAKWLSMTEKGAVPAATPEPPRLPTQPRVAQVMALTKQHGTLGSVSKSSDAGIGGGVGGGGGGGEGKWACVS